MKRTLIILYVLLAGAVGVGVTWGNFNVSRPFIFDDKGHKISLDYFLFLFGIVKDYNDYTVRNDHNFTTEQELIDYWNSINDEGVTNIEALFSDVVESVKTDVIMYNLASDKGLSVDEQEVSFYEQAIDNLVTSMGEDGETYLAKRYLLTKEQMLSECEKLILSQAYKDELFNGVAVDDSALEQYYTDNIEELQEVLAAHILISDSEEKAKEVFELAKDNGDWDELVTSNSDDVNSVLNQGEYVVSRKIQYTPEFTDWVFQAKDGDLGLIESEYGWHVMRRIKMLSFAESKESIENLYRTELATEVIEQLQKEEAGSWTINNEMLDGIDLVRLCLYEP